MPVTLNRLAKKEYHKKDNYPHVVDPMFLYFLRSIFWGVSSWCPRGVMVKAMDCGIVVREFVFQSLYYVHFRTNTLGKGVKPLVLPAMD